MQDTRRQITVSGCMKLCFLLSSQVTCSPASTQDAVSPPTDSETDESPVETHLPPLDTMEFIQPPEVHDTTSHHPSDSDADDTDLLSETNIQSDSVSFHTDLPVDSSPSQTDSPSVEETAVPPYLDTAAGVALPTVPGPTTRQPDCIIPAPGSVAALGALTTNHLTNRIVLSDASFSYAGARFDYNGDGLMELMIKQTGLRGTDLPDPTPYRSSILDVRGVSGLEFRVDRERAYLFESSRYHDGHFIDNAIGNFDGGGDQEILGAARLRYQNDGFLLLFDYPLPDGAIPLDSYKSAVRNSRWPTSNFWAFDVGDWNADGQLDIYITGNYIYPGGYEGLFLAGPLDSAHAGWIDMEDHAFARMLWANIADFPGFSVGGDFDADGIDDIAISSRVLGTNGEVRVWFGPLSGDIDPTIPDAIISSTQPGRYMSMGVGMRKIGDVNGDGVEDLVVPSQHDSYDGMADSGAVYVFLGPLPRGAVLHEADAYAAIHWVHDNAAAGSSVSPLGDIDGNGTDDFAVEVREASTYWETPGNGVPVAPLPPGTEHDPVCTYIIPPWDDGDTDTARDSGLDETCVTFPYVLGGDDSEGAIMLFSNPQPGNLGPADALMTIKGDRIGAVIASYGVQGMGDLDGDGLNDLVFRGQDLQPDGTWFENVYVLHPCSEYGMRNLTP